MSTQPASKFVARKRQERGERRIDAIVTAAAGLFARRGFDGTSMNAIAHACDMSIGSLYQYFPNRDAIVDAVADDYLQKWRAHRAELNARERTGSLADLTLEAIENLFDFHAKHAGIKAFLDADPKRALGIRAVHEELEAAVPILARFYPSKSYDELANVTFVITTIVRGVASMLVTADQVVDRRTFTGEIAAACDAYIVSRLGEPLGPIG